MTTPKILLLSTSQFGRHIDHYYCSKLLRGRFDVTIISLDEGGEPHTLEFVALHELPRAKGFKRAFSINQALQLFENGEFDIVIVTYFRGVSLCSKQLHRISKRCYLDFRTVDVSPHAMKRQLFNRLMWLESKCFENHSVISAAIGDKLHITSPNRIIIPLGCEIIPCSPKSYDNLRLLYVGTLTGRRIEDTVRGLSIVRDLGVVDFTYRIIGHGEASDLSKVTDAISQYGMEDIVKFLGYISTTELSTYYEEANVGVSYVPINEIYDLQPPTKTLEYLGAGLPVLATKTTANAQIVTPSVGLLFNDTPQDFADAVVAIWNMRAELSSATCHRVVESMTWEHVASGIAAIR